MVSLLHCGMFVLGVKVRRYQNTVCVHVFCSSVIIFLTSFDVVTFGNQNDKTTLYLSCLILLTSYGNKGLHWQYCIRRTEDTCCMYFLIKYPQLSTLLSLQNRQWHNMPCSIPHQSVNGHIHIQLHHARKVVWAIRII